MSKRGYTLIELVVVITIVGLLVGFIVPTYKSYIVRSRISTAIPVMKYYAQIGEEYYDSYGTFANAQTLGLNVGSASNTIANPQSVNQYTSKQIVDIDLTAQCYNNIRFTFNGTALGISQNFDIQMLVRKTNGIYQVACGIPFDQTATTYAAVLQYFPASCRDQNVATC